MVDPSAVLLAHSPDPERTVALAARLCYSARDIGDLSDSFSQAEVDGLIEKLIDLGHLSALEHASFTFGIEGVSRALTHQLVRHRLASYSQQSQRYVRLDEMRAIIPPSVRGDARVEGEFIEMLGRVWDFYGWMVERGITPEDARYILPNACETKIIVTMNARELRHFFSLRLCKRAQWEIRRIADLMFREALKAAPGLFKGAGPGCVSEGCPEGEMSCGEEKSVREYFKKLQANPAG